MSTKSYARSEVVAQIEEASDTFANTQNAYASRCLQDARNYLALHDSRPYHWTSEHYTIALRDAHNAARLAIKYAKN